MFHVTITVCARSCCFPGHHRIDFGFPTFMGRAPFLKWKTEARRRGAGNHRPSNQRSLHGTRRRPLPCARTTSLAEARATQPGLSRCAHPTAAHTPQLTAARRRRENKPPPRYPGNTNTRSPYADFSSCSRRTAPCPSNQPRAPAI